LFFKNGQEKIFQTYAMSSFTVNSSAWCLHRLLYPILPSIDLPHRGVLYCTPFLLPVFWVSERYNLFPNRSERSTFLSLKNFWLSRNQRVGLEVWFSLCIEEFLSKIERTPVRYKITWLLLAHFSC